ncbi:MAG: hypothetical protein ACOZIN_21340 [Myxococcota bacterium]
MMRVSTLVALGLLLSACGTKGKNPETPPPLPGLPLPQLPDGKFLLIEASRARVELDPTVSDAITAAGACSELVTSCFDPGTTELDACVAQARGCSTSQPWTELLPCCPSACKEAYDTARAGGKEAFAAFERVFFLDGSCHPGVRTALEAP